MYRERRDGHTQVSSKKETSIEGKLFAKRGHVTFICEQYVFWNVYTSPAQISHLLPFHSFPLFSCEDSPVGPLALAPPSHTQKIQNNTSTTLEAITHHKKVPNPRFVL